MIELLFGTIWTIGTDIIDEHLARFCVDYEQIKAIAKRKDAKATSMGQIEIKGKILAQIKSDEEIARHLQMQLDAETDEELAKDAAVKEKVTAAGCASSPQKIVAFSYKDASCADDKTPAGKEDEVADKAKLSFGVP